MDELCIQFVQARNYTKGPRRKGIDLIVIHTMEAPQKGNTAENIAQWFAGPTAPKASAHYCIDNNSIVQCVLDDDIAWHAPGANSNGIGLEHAGFARQDAAAWANDYNQAMLVLSARLSAMLCAKYEIPRVHLTVDELKAGQRGFCGHIDVTNAFNAGIGHWDPGPHFVWDQYLGWVEDALIFPTPISLHSEGLFG